MAKKESLRTYMVQGKLELMVGVEVSATNLEEAVSKSKSMDENAFVDMHGEYQDGNCRITGVYEI